MSAGIAWTVLTISAAACASRGPEPGDGAPADTPLSYAGQVVVTGTAGAELTTLAIEGGRSVGVVGPLAPEVRSLAGARVRVTGVPGEGFPGEAVEVSAYEVLEVNGERPYVGVLAGSAGALTLEQTSGERVALGAAPGGLAQNVGALLWLTGRLESGRLQVQSFGVIRPR
jgi:hypothetical protein